MLTNKTILITGGSKGIGYGIAKSCLEQGMNVAITARTLSSAQQAADELNSFGNVLALESDVKDYASQEKAVQDTLDKWGQLDALIANAGIGLFASIEDIEVDQWNDVIDTNLTGVFYSIKAALNPLKKSRGYIITISSLAGVNFFAGGAAYNASKFGLTGFTQSVMLDLRKAGVKVSTIMPGSVATYFNNHEPDEADAWKIQPEDLGKLVVDLLQMNPRTLPSKIEVRPSIPPAK
jgi:hypothetical protein